jgi:hypothetical protein
LVALINLALAVNWRADIQGGVAFFILAVMVATIGEYVGGLSRRQRDRPAYYVREEQTSSVLLREGRKNVVDATG